MDFDHSFFSELPLYCDSVINAMSEATPKVNLPWDGSHLGEIDEYIICYRKNTTHDCVFLLDKTDKKSKLLEARITRYRDDIQLIADELKALFKVPKIGKHRCIYKNTECIISIHEDDIPLEDFLSLKKGQIINPYFKGEVQRIFAFRYLVCLNCNFDNKIEVRNYKKNYYPISFTETTFSLDSASNSSKIPNSILKEWFGSKGENLYIVAKELIDDRDIIDLKCKITEIIQRFSKGKYVSWSNSIYDRLQEIKNF